MFCSYFGSSGNSLTRLALYGHNSVDERSLIQILEVPSGLKCCSVARNSVRVLTMRGVCNEGTARSVNYAGVTAAFRNIEMHNVPYSTATPYLVSTELNVNSKKVLSKRCLYSRLWLAYSLE